MQHTHQYPLLRSKIQVVSVTVEPPHNMDLLLRFHPQAPAPPSSWFPLESNAHSNLRTRGHLLTLIRKFQAGYQLEVDRKASGLRSWRQESSIRQWTIDSPSTPLVSHREVPQHLKAMIILHLHSKEPDTHHNKTPLKGRHRVLRTLMSSCRHRLHRDRRMISNLRQIRMRSSHRSKDTDTHPHNPDMHRRRHLELPLVLHQHKATYHTDREGRCRVRHL